MPLLEACGVKSAVPAGDIIAHSKATGKWSSFQEEGPCWWQSSNTKRTVADMQQKFLHDTTAGRKATPLHTSGASVAGYPLI